MPPLSSSATSFAFLDASTGKEERMETIDKTYNDFIHLWRDEKVFIEPPFIFKNLLIKGIS
jgi:hypothetical protein